MRKGLILLDLNVSAMLVIQLKNQQNIGLLFWHKAGEVAVENVAVHMTQKI